MSRMQDVQSADGVLLDYRGYGVMQKASKSAPTNGDKGYAPGAEWFNVVLGTIYCNIGTYASAIWAEIDPGPNQQLQMGGSTSALMTTAGTLYRNMTAGTAPATTGSDIIVDFYALPAGTLNKAGQNLMISAGGSASGVDNCTAKIQTTATLPVIGSTLTSPTALATTGVMSSAGEGWMLQVQLWKYGAAASNTQGYQALAVVVGGTHGGIAVPATLTYTEANVLYVAITINVTTTAADCKLWWWDVAGQN